jgi:hypothetical protein
MRGFMSNLSNARNNLPHSQLDDQGRDQGAGISARTSSYRRSRYRATGENGASCYRANRRSGNSRAAEDAVAHHRDDGCTRHRVATEQSIAHDGELRMSGYGSAEEHPVAHAGAQRRAGHRQTGIRAMHYVAAAKQGALP